MSGPAVSSEPRVTTTAAPGLRPSLLRAVWRIHRALVSACATLGVVLIGLLVLVRVRAGQESDRILATAVECRTDGPTGPLCRVVVEDALYRDFRLMSGLLALACVGLAAVCGALAGAPAFARDFEQRTQVWGLTQSVGRTSWWAAKVLVVLVPVVVIMLAVGAVSSWSLNFFAWADRPMATEFFVSRSFIPAVVAVLAMSLGLSAGILWRSTVAAVLTAVLLTVAVVSGGEYLRPHMLTADRYEQPFTGTSVPVIPDDVLWVDSGYLTAAGDPIEWSGACENIGLLPTEDPPSEEAYQELYAQCLVQKGIASYYSDVLPASNFGLLQVVWAGWVLLLSGLVLAAGYLGLRRRVL